MKLAALVIALALPALARAQPGPEAVATYGEGPASYRILLRGALDIGNLDPAMRAFTAENPEIAVTLEQWNTNDLAAIAAAACRGDAPPADLVMSSAVDQQVKLVNDGCAQPYTSPATLALPPERNWRGELFGLTRESAVMVYNRALVPPEDAPVSRFDLLDLLRRDDGAYRGRVATYDIEASGIGYLFAFLDSTQATTFGRLIEAFGRSGTIATCCSAEIVDAVGRGDYLIGYNVLRPYAMARAEMNPNIAVVAPSDYTLVLSRAAFIPKDAPSPGAAGALIDFLLHPAGQRALTDTFVNEPEAAATASGGAAIRYVPLNPVLLVGLDRQKREQLLALWRRTFPPGR